MRATRSSSLSSSITATAIRRAALLRSTSDPIGTSKGSFGLFHRDLSRVIVTHARSVVVLVLFCSVAGSTSAFTLVTTRVVTRVSHRSSRTHIRGIREHAREGGVLYPPISFTFFLFSIVILVSFPLFRPTTVDPPPPFRFPDMPGTDVIVVSSVSSRSWTARSFLNPPVS